MIMAWLNLHIIYNIIYRENKGKKKKKIHDGKKSLILINSIYSIQNLSFFFMILQREILDS